VSNVKTNMNKYELLGAERKQMQTNGTMPEWYSTAAWMLFKKNYLYGVGTVREQFERIASTAAKHLPEQHQQKAEQMFFSMMWDGILSCSTPVLANTGTDRGLPVSCQGSSFGDSILDIYNKKRDLAVHSKSGFGTSGYLGNIRGRGTDITAGGSAEGVLPVFKGLLHDAGYVSQGSQRRGAFAAYLPIMHQDFDEIIDFTFQTPDGVNIGWNFSDADVQALNNKEPEITRRWKKAMKTKLITGRSYFMFPEKANRQAPEAIKKSGKKIVASNLC